MPLSSHTTQSELAVFILIVNFYTSKPKLNFDNPAGILLITQPLISIKPRMKNNCTHILKYHKVGILRGKNIVLWLGKEP